MVAEPWIQKMRKKTKKSPPPFAAAPDPRSGAVLLVKTLDSVVGILSFEVASAMSRAAHLHRSLSDPDRDLSLPPPPLVPSDSSFLLSLARAEHLDNLNRVASLASRLGRRHCPHHPPLSGFEHVYSDLLLSTPSPSPSPSPSLFLLSAREMDSLVRRMDRFVASTASLYAELELLADLEHSVSKLPGTSDEARRALDRKIQWQRHDVKHLRDSSLWNHKFDKVVLMLAQAVCTIHARIRSVFGDPTPDPPSGAKEGSFRPGPGPGLRFHCGANTGRLFLNCLGSPAAEAETETETAASSVVSFGGKEIVVGTKSRLTMLAPPNTLGGSCLAMHYANVIIIIDKLLKYPHLVGDEARDDLYQMLPASLRLALRRSLKSYVKNLAIYDASLAHDWKEAMERTLGWLVPMSHNMVRWQTERNFEQQQQIVARENVLLLQTLYFADRGKTEDAICELLVGLNYICRYEQQQNALLDCTSSVDFEECMDWQQMQLVDSSGRL
ncbi:uncharacterized protein M6B38_263350 [Iris pallida]|uniref:DUF668 domain-containing protein n=1 Tax=Iris pallida TaxID=29817 RepID=A0AAX6IDT2_IRIPA|nr:uncharacterized protein M6B38_263350 [Iris pallida]